MTIIIMNFLLKKLRFLVFKEEFNFAILMLFLARYILSPMFYDW